MRDTEPVLFFDTSALVKNLHDGYGTPGENK